jgi:hypothetical protein
VHESGVWNVERVFGNRVERSRHFQVLADGQVACLVGMGNGVRNPIRLYVGLRVDPNPSLRISAREGRNAPGGMLGLPAKPWHGFARAGAVELPAVVMTLHVVAHDPACRQRCISMRAPIEQSHAAPCAVAEHDQREPVEHHPNRLRPDLVARGDHVPAWGEIGACTGLIRCWKLW